MSQDSSSWSARQLEQARIVVDVFLIDPGPLSLSEVVDRSGLRLSVALPLLDRLSDQGVLVVTTPPRGNKKRGPRVWWMLRSDGGQEAASALLNPDDGTTKVPVSTS